MDGVLECVANVSEGRRADVLRALAASCGDALLDVHADADHHRSVFTLAGPGQSVALEAALRLAQAVDKLVDLSRQTGVHPRLGALDVVPFVALESLERAGALAAALTFAEAVAHGHGVPVFLYDGADPDGRTLPSVRKEAFVSRAPDFGPTTPHPRLGAVCVSCRPPMVAINCELAGDDLRVASAVAGAVRHRDGGLPGVRALAFPLPSRGRIQVSMNLVDLPVTGVEAALTEVRAQARRRGSDVVAVELVGLLPAAELARCSPGFLSWAGLDTDDTIEARIQAASS